jgi:predicted nucleotidyltransferase
MTTLDQANLKTRDRLAIERAAKILYQHFSARRVVLFGSKARGDDDPESDIDLLVLVDGPVDLKLKHWMRQSLYAVGLELAVCFGTLVVSSQEWEHGVYRVMPIRREIERDGVAA